MVSYTYHESPVGPLLVAGDETGLKVIAFPKGSRKRSPEPEWTEDPAPLAEALRQLDEYFAGERREFDLVLRPEGTPFQQGVWAQLTEIPYGETISYGELATRIGNPKASRAVGAANGANPIPVVIPCHRVIGANKALTGFGGGLDVKRALLDHERTHAPEVGAQGRLF